MDTPTESAATKKPDRLTLVLRWVIAALAVILLAGAAWFGYSYAISPEAIRHPTQAHYHFRMQIINDGTVVNLSDTKYQTPFNKDMCSALITKEPFHLHDGLDQFIHVHWDHVTGGLLLKHYGWNIIGGPDDTLGYKFTKFPQLERVAIHGKSLPNPTSGAKFYIYTGNETSFQERKWDDFIKGDLRGFFAGTPSAQWRDRFAPAALAHGSEVHDATTSATPAPASQAELARLNDVLGSVVLFAQKDQPTDQQVKDRFKQLIPLPLSSCSG